MKAKSNFPVSCAILIAGFACHPLDIERIVLGNAVLFPAGLDDCVHLLCLPSLFVPRRSAPAIYLEGLDIAFVMGLRLRI